MIEHIIAFPIVGLNKCTYYITEFGEDENKCQFWKVDVDECSAVAQRAAIRSMPTFQIYKGGEQVASLK